MKTRIALLGLAVTLFSISAASAQEHPNVVEINPFGGYLFGGKFARGTNVLFTSDVDVDDHVTYGGRLGFNVTRSFELELQYSHTATAFVTHEGPHSTSRYWSASATCSLSTPADAARSAIVLATLSTLS